MGIDITRDRGANSLATIIHSLCKSDLRKIPNTGNVNYAVSLIPLIPDWRTCCIACSMPE